MKHRLFMLLSLTLLLVACRAHSTPTAVLSDGKSGIKGQVFLAECQGQQIATDCFSQEPYQATLIIYNAQLQEVARILTQQDGTFELELEPGMYFIHPYSPGTYPIANDYQVVVTEGKMTELTIIYDSGTR
ncbi:MAG: hypothetical protein N2049_05980 [Anaerolineales bacterium]|nr:hypothetical protein [Anaerolineales bacterium]